MNKKKRNVIDKAHQLFIEKGYHATSIQDILEHSGISKGSFYNYFASKGELFKSVFNLIQENMSMERDKLLIGEDLTDKGIFIEQISLMMELNRKNKLHQLIEDVLVSNEPELIEFIKQTRYLFLNWLYERFLNIFANNQAKFLMDCAVLYAGMMQHILQTNHVLSGTIPIRQIAQYCLDRVMTILDDISSKDIQLFVPEDIHRLLPQSDYYDFFNHELSLATLNVKRVLEKQFQAEEQNSSTYIHLLFFIQEELMNNKEEPRKFLIESALTTLKTIRDWNQIKECMKYEEILAKMNYYSISQGYK